MTDDALLHSARQGDRRALETLLARYQPKVFRYGLQVCGNPEDAGDVLQDSLLAMTRTVSAFRGEASLSTWFFTVARRFCQKKRRKSRFAPETEQSWEALVDSGPEPVASEGTGPDEALIRDETRHAMEAAIASLEPVNRAVLVLRDLEGFSNQEVADRLGLKLEAVKSRLHRSRRAVRERLATAI